MALLLDNLTHQSILLQKVPKIAAISNKILPWTPPQVSTPKITSLLNLPARLLQEPRNPCVVAAEPLYKPALFAAGTNQNRWNSLFGLALEVHRSKV